MDKRERELQRYRSKKFQERKKDRNRRRRRRRLVRGLILSLLLLLLILLVFLIWQLASWTKKEIEETGGIPLPWKKVNGVVMLDAGHGDTDPGTMYDDIQEKDLNLQITKKVEALLKEDGYRVQMVRKDDTFTDVHERAEYANEREPDIYVSIHCNFVESGEADGIETYYSQEKGSESEKLAELIQTQVIKQTGANDRGVRTEDYVVVKETKMPAALVETGFLSDPDERELLQDEGYQEKLALGIAKGIEAYLGKGKQE